MGTSIVLSVNYTSKTKQIHREKDQLCGYQRRWEGDVELDEGGLESERRRIRRESDSDRILNNQGRNETRGMNGRDIRSTRPTGLLNRFRRNREDHQLVS